MAYMGEAHDHDALMRISILAALAASTLTPRAASAHAPPQIIDVVSRAGSGLVFVANRGLILAESESGPFRLLCTEATKTNTAEEPDLVVTPDGQLVLATSRGLIRSADGGCSFEPVPPLDALLVPAAAADPQDAAHFYVAAFDATRGGLFETRDSGDSFSRLQPASESDFIATILIAPSQPERVYVDGQLIADGTITPYVAVSDDGGVSFERFGLALLPTESSFELLAVSPMDADVLVGRAADADSVALQDRLLVSRDRGQTWSSPLTVHAMTEARFSGDGGTLWVAGIDGVFRGTGELTTFEQLPDATRISLASEQAGQLWLCGHYDGMHDGVARMDSRGELQPLLAFSDITEPAACGAEAPSAVACRNLWRDWQREILGIQPDAGAAGASSDAGTESDAATGPEPRPAARGGCSVERGRIGSATPPTMLLAALALAALGTRTRLARRLCRPRRLCEAATQPEERPCAHSSS